MEHFFRQLEGWGDGILPVYQQAVKQAQSGAHFVEVGTWAGRSAAAMAVEIVNSGKKIRFDCVDTWKGAAHDVGMCEEAANRDVFEEFQENMRRGGVHHLVHPVKKSSCRAARDYADESLDFIFIDAAHDQVSVEHDICAWWPKLKLGGTMAGHDYGGFNQTWVAQAVHNMFDAPSVGTQGGADGQECWFTTKTASRNPRRDRLTPRVFLALPNRPGDSFSGQTVASLWNAGTRHKVVQARAKALSMLNYSFNLKWCEAWNRRGEFDYFVMLHSDVAPEPGWLDKLIELYVKAQVDVLSCTIAIKDGEGLSSTGVMNWSDRVMRKLSVGQTLELPPIFSAETFPVDVLLLNTGCWITRMEGGPLVDGQPWQKKVCFRCHDWTWEDENGELQAGVLGEDYLWSAEMAKWGVKTAATNAVRILHRGEFDYPNYVAFGDGSKDQVRFSRENINGKASNLPQRSADAAVAAGRHAAGCAGVNGH